MQKNISDIPPELILQTMSFMKSKDIKVYCKINPRIDKICKENNNLIVKYGLMNDLEITKDPSRNVLQYLLPYSDNIKSKSELDKIFSYAAKDDRVDVISFLIENGIKPSNYDEIIYKSINNDSVNVFKYLLDKLLKEEIEEYGEYNEEEPFDFEYFLTAFFMYSEKIIDYLISYRSSTILANLDDFIDLLGEKGDNRLMIDYLERFRSGEYIKFSDFLHNYSLRNSFSSFGSRDSLSTRDSLSGGSPDASLQKVLMKNIQKEYGIRLPSKIIKKKSKNKSKNKRNKRSPLKYEIKVGGGEKRSQYYGKRSKVMVKVPENVKNTALYAFKLKKLGFRGGLETGWKRAKQLATKESIPIQDLKYMRAWFARHLYTSYPTYKKWKAAGRPKTKEWHKKNGIISWLIWSGSPALNWVNSKVGLLNKHYPNKNYKKITVKK
jgi:hypothetical protein